MIHKALCKCDWVAVTINFKNMGHEFNLMDDLSRVETI